MDPGADSGCLQVPQKAALVHTLHTNGKKMPAGFGTLWRGNDADVLVPDSSQICRSDLAPAPGPLFQARQAGLAKKSSLQFIQAAVIAGVLVTVLGTLTVVA